MRERGGFEVGVGNGNVIAGRQCVSPAYSRSIRQGGAADIGHPRLTHQLVGTDQHVPAIDLAVDRIHIVEHQVGDRRCICICPPANQRAQFAGGCPAGCDGAKVINVGQRQFVGLEVANKPADITCRRTIDGTTIDGISNLDGAVFRLGGGGKTR